jgi:ribosome recycling factor
LTEERRKDLVKACNKTTEESKVSIRNIRRDLNDQVRALEKNKEISEDASIVALEDIQKIVDKGVKKLEEILALKEKDILEI